jgi:integrase/recombinase XerD
LYKWISDHTEGRANERLFPVHRRNIQATITRLCKRLGIKGVGTGVHQFRHAFSCQYLLNGGDLFMLSRLLGHGSVKMTERYLRAIQTEQLGAVHERFSPLGASRKGGNRKQP